MACNAMGKEKQVRNRYKITDFAIYIMRKFKITALIMAAALGVCAMAGCGKTTTDNNSDDLEKVTFMLDWTPNTNHTGLYVAQEKGYFKEAGLDVEIIECAEAGAEASVADGTVNFGVSFQDYLVPAFSADEESQLPVTAVAAIIQHNTSGIISLKENGIDSPKGMENHTYATWEMPIEQALIKKVVTDDGGDYDKIQLIPTYVEDIKAALSSTIDTVWIYYAWDGIACELEGLDTNFFYLKDYSPELDEYSPVIIANNDFLEKNPETAKKFMEALSKGYNFAIENPDEAAEILVNANEGLDLELCKASQNWLAGQYTADADKWGVIDQDRWDGFFGWVYDNGLCDVEIPAGFGFSNEYLPE